MKKYLICFYILFAHLFFLIIPAYSAILTRFKLQIIEDGKPTENILVGNINIFDNNGKTELVWEDIYISPMHYEKKIFLKPEHNSTSGGTITDVFIGKDQISFKIKVALGRDMQIIGKKKMLFDDGTTYNIEGVGLWWNELTKTNNKIEWRSIDNEIVLPYKEIY